MPYEAIGHRRDGGAVSNPIVLDEAVPGGRVELFAIEDGDYPGGWFYRFQYYHPDVGHLLRYDNAHDDPELGHHHRHVGGGDDTPMTFQNLVSHVASFFQEIAYLTEAYHD